MKTFTRLGLSALLFAASVLAFGFAAYLFFFDSSQWRLAILLGAGLISSALLLASAFLHPGLPAAGCNASNIQAVLGCLVSEDHERTSYTSSAIVYHYKQTYNLGPLMTLTRPSIGSAEERRTCHRCGSEVPLRIHSAAGARRETLSFYRSLSAMVFGGWSIYCLLYFVTPPEGRSFFPLFALAGVGVSLFFVGGWFKLCLSTTLQRAAQWPQEGDHRWFDSARKALRGPFE